MAMMCGNAFFKTKKKEMKCFSKCNALKFNILNFGLFFLTAMSHIRYIYTRETSQNMQGTSVINQKEIFGNLMLIV